MKQPAPVSVIIPAYNSETYIGQAIQSVLAQTLPVARIIVVDDGSSDRTAEVAERLGASVIRKSNQGVSAARNTGIGAAEHEWIAFLDQDDLWAPQKIEYQFAAGDRFRDAGVISCEMTWFRDEDPEREPAAFDFGGLTNTKDAGLYDRLMHKLPFVEMTYYLSSLLVRRDLLLSVGMFDERLRQNEDLECFLRLIAKSPAAIVRRTLVARRIHPRNASTMNPEEASASYIRILNWLRGHPEKYPPGAARAYNGLFSRGLTASGRDLLEQGEMQEARQFFRRSLGSSYSTRALLLWFLSFLGPRSFKSILTVKRKLSSRI